MRKAFKMILILMTVGFMNLSAKADSHWLDFNPYGYRSEFFTESGITRGSCGAAAVVIVECHLNLCSSISSSAVLNKNNQMRNDPTPSMRPYLSGSYYISSIDGIGTRLQRDGYKVNWYGTSNRQQAAINIFNILARKRWVIIVSRQGFTTSTNIWGHFYPIYGGNLVRNNSGQIDENLSKLNAIEDFNSSYNPNSPNWTTMYRSIPNGNAPTIKQVLDSMYSASSYGVYNIIEVYK